MNKKKVLTMISSMGDGGAQRIVLNYMDFFYNDNDVEMKLLVYNHNNHTYCDNYMEERKYNVKYLNAPKNKILRKLYNIFFLNYVIKKEIKKYNPDIIHVHITRFLKYVAKPIYKSGVKTKFVTLHSNPLRQQGRTLKIIRKSFEKYGFIPICLNNEQKNIAENHYKFKEFEIIHNGINTNEIKNKMIPKEIAKAKFGISNNYYVIGSIGRLNPIKNYQFLLKVFADLLNVKPECVLIIAGEGPQKEELIKLSENLKISNNVKFLGNVNNPIEFYCALDKFVQTSISEACSLVLLEAQCCNLDCVVSFGIPIESIVTSKVKRMEKNQKKSDWIKYLLKVDINEKKYENMENYELINTMNVVKNIYLKYGGNV